MRRTLVGFGARARSLGEGAKTQEISNFRNTVGSLKRLIGRTSLEDPDVEIEKKYLNAELCKVGATVGVNVNYLGERQAFSATQLYAMFLGHLRDTAARELHSAVNDMVVAVPGWYTDAQRRAVLDAAEIAGLNPLRLINDTTATALGYGITKTDLPAPEQPPRMVAFVDVGHSDYSVAIVQFHRGQLTVLATEFDRHYGGRDLDYALVQHFAAQFKDKYKIDVLSNKKALFRLTAAVERCKKVLSANAQAPLSVESIMEDIDASSMIKREEFEELIAPLLERLADPIERAVKASGLQKTDIDAVELVGGTTRVPAIKNRIQETFGRPLSFTTNQDEAIARGATLACAMLSPIFRVRDFSTTDTNIYPIDITWEATPDSAADEGTELRTFDTANAVPSTKVLSFNRSEPFSLEARYADPSVLPGAVNPFIGKLNIKKVQKSAKGEAQPVKVKARLNLSGILTFESATLVQEVPEDAAAADESTPMETDANGDAQADGAATPEAPAPKKAKKTTKVPLPIVVQSTSLDTSVLNDYREKEGQMAESDKLVLQTEERKNALEEYVYDTREKLDGAWSGYVNEADKEKLKAKLTDAEDWLYSEEGEDANKSAYVKKLDELKVLGDPIQLRHREADARGSAIATLRETLTGFLERAQSGAEQYAHIPEADIQKVIEECANTEAWLANAVAKQAERPKDLPPVFTSTELRKKAEE